MTTHHFNLSHQEHFFAFFLPHKVLDCFWPPIGNIINGSTNQTRTPKWEQCRFGAQLELAEVADLDPLG